MKTAVSIPDRLFETVEELCKRHRIPRSRFYAMAIKQFVDAYRENDVTERLNRVYANESSSLDPALAATQIRALTKEKW
jgi:metal-responsive CopG/Arc/MetJ family transcriptional regulator